MKRSIVSVLAVIVVLSMLLTACGGAAATATPAPAAATSTTAPAAATNTTAPAAAEPTATTAAGTTDTSVSGKMTFMSWYTEEQYKPVLDAFKAKYPDLTIDYQNVTPANNAYGDRLKLLASSGELPDLFYVQPPTTLMAKNGYLADLSDMAPVKALPASFTSSYTYNGKVYAFAPDAWIGGAFYNKGLFRENNIAEPKTWDDFLAAAKIFHDKGIKPIAFSADGLPDLLYWRHNTEIVSQDPLFDIKINSGETTFTQGYLQAAKDFKTYFLDTGYIGQDTVGLSDDQRLDEFATGQAATTTGGPWLVGTFKQKNPNLDLGIFPFVGSTPDRTYTIGAVNVGLAISAKAQNKAAAQAFINFLGSNEGLALYQKITGNFLGIKGIPYTIDPVMEPMRQYAESGKFAFTPIDWTNTDVLAPMMVKGMQQIVLGSVTPEQFVKDLDDKQAELAANQK